MTAKAFSTPNIEVFDKLNQCILLSKPIYLSYNQGRVKYMSLILSIDVTLLNGCKDQVMLS